MNRRFSFGIFLFLVLGFFLTSCGSGNIGAVCGAAVDRLFELCDQDDPDDQLTIWNALNPGLGIAVSTDEIAEMSKGDVKGECESGLEEEEAEISDSDVESIEADLENASSCQEIADLIMTYGNAL